MDESSNDTVLLSHPYCDEVELTYDDERVPIEYQKMTNTAKTPTRATTLSAGYDLYSPETIVIPPLGKIHLDVGLVVKPPKGWCIKLYNRSSLACNDDVMIPGSPTIVDCDYRGNVKVCLKNYDRHRAYEVKKGQRIAQAMVERCYKVRWIVRKSLAQEKTERGTGGFCSTGK